VIFNWIFGFFKHVRKMQASLPAETLNSCQKIFAAADALRAQEAQAKK